MTCSVKSLAPMTMWEERGGAQATSSKLDANVRAGIARAFAALITAGILIKSKISYSPWNMTPKGRVVPSGISNSYV
jgi:hypothetical protein